MEKGKTADKGALYLFIFFKGQKSRYEYFLNKELKNHIW